ncbi:MAG: response regulator [Proteobacteria bacterium]|nr:response regulator [Pseudomonadota bacterium]
MSITEKSILYVEDLDSPREIITKYVQALGFQNIDSVDSAKNAIAKLQSDSEKYFCVIADINMPDVNGIALVREIRKSDNLKHLPVIMLTAYPTDSNLIECIKAGATGFIAKPPKKKLLIEELEKSLDIFLKKKDPRICNPEDADLVDEALSKIRSSV